MRRRALLAAVATLALSLPSVIAAQPERKLPMVGLLFLGAPGPDPNLRGKTFRDGMAALGWSEGRSVAFELRFADGSLMRLRELALELAASGVNVIAAFGNDACLAARRATASIPIVMAGAADPIRDGLIVSFARPGGNVTGVLHMNEVIVAKQLELLSDGLPGLRRVSVLHRDAPRHPLMMADIESTATRLGIKVQSVLVAAETDLPGLFQRMAGAEALIVLAHPLMDQMRGRIAELALRHGLPSMGPGREYADAGFLFSYAASHPAIHQRAASFVDKILKGASPATLPVELPTRYELVVNQNTAWALGINVSPSLLARADEVIE